MRVDMEKTCLEFKCDLRSKNTFVFTFYFPPKYVKYVKEWWFSLFFVLNYKLCRIIHIWNENGSSLNLKRRYNKQNKGALWSLRKSQLFCDKIHLGNELHKKRVSQVERSETNCSTAKNAVCSLVAIELLRYLIFSYKI